jgi:hypothetical protein
MRPYFDSPDTTIPEHIRMMYRTFELDQVPTSVAVEMIVNDVMQPRFKKFRGSFYNKAFRVLGYGGVGSTTGADSTVFNDVKRTIDDLAEKRMAPFNAYRHLLSLKKEEPAKVEEPATVETGTDAATVDSAGIAPAPVAN